MSDVAMVRRVASKKSPNHPTSRPKHARARKAADAATTSTLMRMLLVAALFVVVVASALLFYVLAWSESSPPSPPSLLLERCKVRGEPDRRFRIMSSTVPGGGDGVFSKEPHKARRSSRLCLFDGEDLFEPTRQQQADSHAVDGTMVGLAEGTVRRGYRTARTPCGVGQLVNDAHRIHLEAPITWLQAWSAVET